MTTAAVIGCGDVSVVHLRAIAELPGVKLVAVCDTDPAEFAGVPAFTDHRELLDRVRPDVVHVCTPHDQHAQVAIDCLDAGSHVLIEKPVAHTVAEAERVLAAALRPDSPRTGICLQNRYNAPARAAHDLLRSGELGAVTGGSATLLWHRDAAYYRSRPWRGQLRRSGGGVLINQAIHTLDLLQWLLGPVQQVQSTTSRYALSGLDVEDTAMAHLTHTGGATSVFFATVTHTTDAPVTVEVVTERAVLTIRGDLTVTYADGRTEVVPEHRAETGGRAYWGTSHQLLIADFYRTLAGPAPFWIDVAEGLGSLRLVDRIYRQNT